MVKSHVTQQAMATVSLWDRNFWDYIFPGRLATFEAPPKNFGSPNTLPYES